MKTLKIIITFLSVCLLNISCTNDNDGTKENLPSISTEGKNTFGCRINGEIFLPKSRGGFSAGYRAPILFGRYYNLVQNYYGQEPGYYLQINAYNELTNKSINIELTKSDVALIEGNTYQIVSKSNGVFDAEYSFSTTAPYPDTNNAFIYTNHEYKTNNEYIGELKILKIDSTNLIISGTFTFDSINSVDNKTAEIREGRFDLKYEPNPN